MNFRSYLVPLYFWRSKVSYSEQKLCLLEFLISFALFGYEVSPAAQSFEWSARSCALLYWEELHSTCGCRLLVKMWSFEHDFYYGVYSRFPKAFSCLIIVYAAFLYQLKQKRIRLYHRSSQSAQSGASWCALLRILRLSSHQMLIWIGCIRVLRTDSCLKTVGMRLHCLPN
jgi:hypothetical protein